MTQAKRSLGIGRVLVAVYGVFALSASARALYQLATKFQEAPLSYSLSALAGIVYIVATIALGRRNKKLALAAVWFELVGVFTVGLLSYLLPADFEHKTVWSHFGSGYGYVPALLPILGLVWLYRSEKKPNGSVVTIGKFDGVHLGHKALLAKLAEVAAKSNLSPWVLTFDRHPDALLNPARLKPSLIGPEQKQSLLLEAGASLVLTLPFDEALAAMSPREFVEAHLVKSLTAKSVVVGPDFRFGNRGAGDLSTLRELGQEFGFEVIEVPQVFVHGEPVSSTRIRELLEQGDVERAAELLGRNHATVGIVEHGRKIGRTIGFPTANISRDADGLMPVDGIYAGWLTADGVRYPTAISIGINETFEAVPRLVEAHVIGRDDLDLYDKTVRVEYVRFVRPPAKFNGVDDLIEQINKDVAECSAILKEKV